MGSLVVQQCRGWARVIASLVFILATPEAGASYINIIHAGLDSEFAAIEGEVSSGFALSGTAWNPGPGTSRVGGSPAPGGATWSVLPEGLGLHPDLREGTGGLFDFGHRLVARSGDFDLLLAAPGREVDMVGETLDVWASYSGFTNLGQLADGGAAIGSPQLLAGIGDIRVGVIELFPAGTLAHAFRPSTSQRVMSGGSAGGDIHIDRDRSWLDDPNDTNPRDSLDYDLYTVLLHEMGHALGLAHSSSPVSVMFGSYSGGRRELSANDILGIQAIYGASVPEPGTLACVCGGLVGLAFRRRRCSHFESRA